MTASLPPLFDSDDPRLQLRVQNRMRNIFVTQSEDTRNREEENVNHIPVVTESPSRLLEAGVNTLQKTLVLKKQAELDEVNKQLALKRQEFNCSLQLLAQRRSELETKRQQAAEKAMKLEKFVKENAVTLQKKHEAAQKQNVLMQRESEELSEQLQQLQARKHVLKERVSKYKIFEDYLMKTLDYLPKNYLDNGSESAVMPIIRHYETLSITHQELLQRLGCLEEELEENQWQLQTMKQGHSMKKLMANKELSELQSELEGLKEKNEQAEANLLTEQDESRKKAEEVGSIFMAVNNLAELCYLPAYGALENMSVLTKMEMVKEFILDQADTERRARRLMESGSAVTSRTALTDKKERNSLRSIGSKTQIKSSSKIRQEA